MVLGFQLTIVLVLYVLGVLWHDRNSKLFSLGCWWRDIHLSCYLSKTSEKTIPCNRHVIINFGRFSFWCFHITLLHLVSLLRSLSTHKCKRKYAGSLALKCSTASIKSTSENYLKQNISVQLKFTKTADLIFTLSFNQLLRFLASWVSTTRANHVISASKTFTFKCVRCGHSDILTITSSDLQ